MNPLDMPGDVFLALYFTLAVAMLLAAWGLRTVLGPASADITAPLDPLSLAYLAGGPERAMDTALLGLVAAGGAGLDPDKPQRIRIEATRGEAPGWMQPFFGIPPGLVSRAAFHAAAKPSLARTEEHLVRQGLLAGPAAVSRWRSVSWLLLAIPLLLGCAKLVVGLSRGRPVLFLVLALVITLAIAVILLNSPAPRTRAGNTALAQAQTTHARAARAPLEHELLLAFALSGTAVLASTAYAKFTPILTPPSSSDGGGGGGGGDGGGGGCGGCSG